MHQAWSDNRSAVLKAMLMALIEPCQSRFVKR
jgi:hypothetical protein